MKLYESIKKAREHYGHSQQIVADKINISRVAYNQIELGKRDVSAIELKSIASFYGISTDSLLRGFKELSVLEIGDPVEYNSRVKDYGLITAICIRQSGTQYAVTWSDKVERWHFDFELKKQ